MAPVRLSEIAYYGTGGSADVILEPKSLAELAQAVKAASRGGRRLMLLGGGTNSLVSDEHFPGTVILFRGLGGLEVRGSTIVAGAGITNTAFAEAALAAGLAGAGWMNRLPGQIGGTVRMNARCYGGEISQIARKIRVVTRDGEIKELAGPAVFRGYKDTVLMQTGDLVAEAEFDLIPTADTEPVRRLMATCEKDRIAKGQFAWPSCGCVFKNDYSVGVPSGLLLETAGAKGLSHRGAVVSSHHANFVFNQGADARAILELAFRMQDLVYRRFGVWMEFEMEILGDLPEDLDRRYRQKKAHSPVDAELAPLRARMKVRS